MSHGNRGARTYAGRALCGALVAFLLLTGGQAAASVLTVDEASDIGADSEIVPLAATMTLNLDSGFNLVSWNTDTANDSIAVIVQPIVADVIQVLGFETSAINPNSPVTGAKLYDPTLPDFVNSLKVTDHRLGYWIKMTNANTLDIGGTAVAVDTPIPLTGGFNLVSYMPDFNDTTAHGVATTMDSLIQVLGFETALNNPNSPVTGAKLYDPTLPDFVNSLKIMSPQLGYWVKVTGTDTLTYPTVGVASVPAGRPVPFALDARMDMVRPTDKWMGIWGELAVDGELAPEGTVVDVVDDSGNLAGSFQVHHAGYYGYLPIYQDDGATAVDEGAQVGEWLTVRVNGQDTDAKVQWTEFGDLVKMDIQSVSPSAAPTAFALLPNYPNPFNPETTIAYELPRQERVSLAIYNALGQTVRQLVSDIQPAGLHRVVWDASDESGNAVSSGAYFYRLEAGSFTQMRRMMLVR